MNQKRAELHLTIEELKQELQNLEREKQRLEAGIRYTEGDEYLEKKLREQGYKKPGEEVVVVKKQEPENKNQTLEQGLLDRILGKFLR